MSSGNGNTAAGWRNAAIIGFGFAASLISAGAIIGIHRVPLLESQIQIHTDPNEHHHFTLKERVELVSAQQQILVELKALRTDIEELKQ